MSIDAISWPIDYILMLYTNHCLCPADSNFNHLVLCKLRFIEFHVGCQLLISISILVWDHYRKYICDHDYIIFSSCFNSIPCHPTIPSWCYENYVVCHHWIHTIHARKWTTHLAKSHSYWFWFNLKNLNFHSI